jgi:hypothetical protein
VHPDGTASTRRQKLCAWVWAAWAYAGKQWEPDLKKTLAAHKVGLKARPERIAPPRDTGRMETGAAQQRIVEDRAKGRSGGQLLGDGAADDREDLSRGKAILREEPIGGAPILELRSGSSKQAGHGVTSEAKQRAQREGLRARGDAALLEGGEAFIPELLEAGEEASRVFFKAAGGGTSRRSASSALSSTIHSTVSPRENSIA